MTKHSKERVKDILLIAKKHFLRHGFKDASLRHIAKEAGVTTGAIYTHFKNKEEIFGALVKEVVDNFFETYSRLEEAFISLSTEEKLNIFNGFYQESTHYVFEPFYEQRDVYRLLFLYSEGTAYENFFERWVEMEVRSNVEFLKSIEEHINFDPSFDKANMHIIQSGYFKGIVEILKLDIPLDQARIYMENLTKYSNAGWRALLNM